MTVDKLVRQRGHYHHWAEGGEGGGQHPRPRVRRLLTVIASLSPFVVACMTGPVAKQRDATAAFESGIAQAVRHAGGAPALRGRTDTCLAWMGAMQSIVVDVTRATRTPAL